MVRLIDADAVMEKLREKFLATNPKDPEQLGYLNARLIIRDQPTIDAEPVRHGRWVFEIYSYSTPKCSCCGWHMPYSEDSTLDARNYCPNCGAKMDLKEEDK